MKESLKVFRGITTGYNPAFIIDENKKNELIAADERNAALVKPLLQGRNIRRWTSNESGFSILTTGFDIDIKTKYRSLFTHLNQYRKALKKRDDQGKNWWNLLSQY